jgi:hypothetical protein
MTKVTFLLANDPSSEHGGDIELARVAMRLAAQSFDVSAICKSRKSGPEADDTAEVFAAEDNYMADSLLRTSRANAVGFVINTISTESQVPLLPRWRSAPTVQ